MAAITSENRDAWQALANDLDRNRPHVGRRVKVTGGRKYKGREGTVVHHMVSRFCDPFRYASDAQAHVREMAGRFGFVVRVRDDGGAEFWVDADKVDCCDVNATEVN
jgi:hypothetical protein